MLTPKSPIIPAFQKYEIVVAKDQPEYMPLPALALAREDKGALVTRWELTPEDRAAIAAGADIYITMLTFGNPVQPLMVNVLNKEASTEELVKATTEGVI